MWSWNPPKSTVIGASPQSVKLCKKSINKFDWRRSAGRKTNEIKHLVIESIFSPPFYLPLSPPSRTPPHASTIFTKGYFAKSAHIALSVIKMNCWCASVQPHKCAKSDGTLLVCERMPSVRRMCLSLMYSHRVQCWQGGATLNQSLAWQVSKHCGETVQKLTSPRC